MTNLHHINSKPAATDRVAAQSAARRVEAPESRLVQPTAFDLTLARRLVLKCESSAASGKAWALILSRRMQDQRPLSPAAVSVGSRICDGIELAARELKDTASRLAGLFDEQQVDKHCRT
jgi:hypothetical protein